ncbi:crossover junction endonuclease MUS81 [Tricladium varicosporioides]|nr:crossover junction endonuclease MUS81 [Hymenoscyphus varicosporioides]
MADDDDCANPLLLSWVKEWLDTARERNSKGVTTYKKAYDSMKSCPLPFTHPSEAQQLTGFGPKLCSRLTDKLKEYCEENGLPMPEMSHRKRKGVAQENSAEGSDGEAAPAKKTRKLSKPKAYVPKYKSGGYAIILALATLDEDSPNGLTKPQTIELAQPHSDSSFSAPSDPTAFYTAWNSMKTLISKDLVFEKGRPLRKYALTDEGWEVAKRIKKTNDENQSTLTEASTMSKSTVGKANSTTKKAKGNPPPTTDEDSFIDLASSPPPASRPIPPTTSHPPLATQAAEIPMGTPTTSTSCLPSFTPITLAAGTFTIELVLDVREVRAKADRDYIQNQLMTRGVKPIMRALELGDILWVAKTHTPIPSESSTEIVLDYIVERKRLDDLVGSIKDGRFHEQKFRLKKSGIKNVIYIIEEIRIDSDHFQKYEESVQSAIASMQVVNGFFVKKTQKMDDTILYLTRMTALLKSIYEERPLHIIPTKFITNQNYLPLMKHLRATQESKDFYITYETFAGLASKSESLTLRDVYLKMLMCTRGVTGEKALEIQKRWRTPNEFLKAYQDAGEAGSGGGEKRKRKYELVSSKMGDLVGRKKIQKALSVKIAEVWGMDKKELNTPP